MLDETILWVCIALEGLLLVRAVRTNLFKEFPVFYFYIGSVLARDLLGTPVYIHYPSLYSRFYWSTEFAVAVISYALVMEIYSRSLQNYPGAARLFKIILSMVFIAIAAKIGLNCLGSAPLPLVRAIADLERSLRQLQALLLTCLLGLFVYYKIPVAKNLRGVALGYALFVGTYVIILTFVSHPATGFGALMRILEPLSYVVSLLIWSVALWVPSPEAAGPIPCKIQEDYEHLAQETRMLLLRARRHLAKVGRP